MHRAITKKSEVARLPRDSRHDRIDFEESPILAGFRVTIETSCAEPDNADSFLRKMILERGEELPDGTVRMIVSHRQPSPCGILELGAVNRRAVNQEVRGARRALDAIRSKER